MGIADIIEKEMDNKRLKYGVMGTELISIILDLTEAQKEEFLALDLPDNYHYALEGNTLFVLCTDEI